MIKVRFAPSPTGYLHIGGARTALFNWMYARAQNGAFVLRIEDTDLERSRPEFIDVILDGMKWLGLEWDELYKQSERFDIYREHADKLLKEDKAYRDGQAVILKVPDQSEVKLFDLIRGGIVFDTETIKDQVLMKSDGSPTYSFACVVDDALMEITHVVRGEDHISNTPKQLLIYQALGLKPPKYAHLPLIMGTDGGRLSKRTGAVAVGDYQKQGFLPEAVVNYLMLLGWSPGDNREIMTLGEAVKKFSIKKINKAAAIFDLEKLTWINQQYMKQADPGRLAELARPFLVERGYIDENYDGKALKNIVELYQSRMPTFLDLADRTAYLYEEDFKVGEEARREHLSKDLRVELDLLSRRFADIEDFSAANVEKSFRAVAETLQMKTSELVHPVRVALTGSDIGPGLFETIELLGKDKTVKRLKTAYS